MQAMERGFDAMRDFYGRTLTVALDHPRTVMLVLAGTVALNFYLFAIDPKGFFPQQDTGTLIGQPARRSEHLVSGDGRRSCATSWRIVQARSGGAGRGRLHRRRRRRSGRRRRRHQYRQYLRRPEAAVASARSTATA